MLIRTGLGLAVAVAAFMPLILGYLNPTVSHASTPLSYNYTNKFDTTTDGGYVQDTGVVTDSSGDTYVTGWFSGTVVFNPSDPSTAITAPYWYSAFVTKYNSDGSYVWTQAFLSFNYTNDDEVQATGITVDGSGNVYVVGNMYGEGDFNGNDLGTGGYAEFITQIQANGTYGWTNIISGFTSTVGVASDPSGYIYVVGGDTMTQYNSSGGTVNTIPLDSTSGAVTASGVTSDGSGNIYVTGDFSGSVTFGGVNSFTYSGCGKETFLSKYNASITYQWTETSLSSTCLDNANGVTTDSSGNVYVVGNFTNSVEFNPPNAGSTITVGNWGSAFLTKYNSSGTYQWTEAQSGSSGYHPYATGNGVATDSSGDVYMTGAIGSSSTSDDFLNEYNSNGSLGLTKSFNTTNGTAEGTGVAVDINGKVSVVGDATGTVVFDGTGGYDSQTLGSSPDSFLTNYNPVYPITATTVGPGSIAVNSLTSAPSATISGSSSVSAVSCVSSVSCVAVGTDFSYQGITSSGTFSGGSWTWTTATTVAPDSSGGGSLYSVSCPTSTMCIAVGTDNNEQGIYSTGTFSGGSWAWTTATTIASAPSGTGGWLYGVNCPTSTNCIAVGEDYLSGIQRSIYTSGTDSGGVWTWTTEAVIAPDPEGAGNLTNISCPTSTMCIAVGNDDYNLGHTTVGTYSGGSWTWTAEAIIPSGSTGGADIYGISCPDSTTCVAVGIDYSGQGVTSSGTYSGGGWTWTPETTVTSDSSGTGFLTAVSCPTPTLCIGIGFDANDESVSTVGTYSGGSWTWTTEAISGVTNLNDNPLFELGIDCYDSSDCVMAGGATPYQGVVNYGTILSGNISWNSQISIPLDSTGNGSVSAVGCPTSTTCIAIQSENESAGEGTGSVYSIGSLSGGTWAWTPDTPIVGDGSGVYSLGGVSCPTSTTCIAVGDDNNSQGFYTVGTYSGGSWSWTAEATITSDSYGYGWLRGMSCPTSTMCIAVGADSHWGIDTIGTDSGGVWTWTTEAEMTPDLYFGNESFSGISCVSSTTCIAIGEDGFQDSYTVGTYSGGSWTWTSEVAITPDPSGYGESGYGALSAISCISSTECIAVGTDGNQRGISTVGTYSGGIWTWTTEDPIRPDSSGQGSLNSISCLSSGLCVAVGTDNNGQSIETLGTAGGSTITWTQESVVTPDSNGYGDFTGVVCNTSVSCLATGADDNYINFIGNYSGATLFNSVPINGFLAVYGSNQLFNITPNIGYQISNVLVDGVSVGTPSSYTFTNVAVGHTIEADFGIMTNNISASTSGSGSISPSGATAIDYGNDQSYTITPDTGWYLSNVLVDGVSVGTPSSYTFTNVTSAHTIEADFAPTTNDITVNTSGFGSISPSGTTAVNYGSDQLYSISPDVGYQISNVLVDGVSVGTPSSYTFTNVTVGHTIEADFSPIPNTISATTVGSGSIFLSGLTTLPTILVGSDITGEGALYGVSCPTSTTCIAVGADFNGSHAHSVTSTGTLSGGVWSWTTEATVLSDAGDFINALTTVDCVSSTKCVAVGSGLNGWISTTGTLSGGNWTWSQEVVIPPDFSGSVLGNPSTISCPTSTTCFVGGEDWDGNAITSIGTLSGGVWSWAAETTVTQEPSSLSNFLAMSCPSSTMCIASGYDNASGGITSVGTLSGGVWTWAPETDVVSDSSGWGNLVGISCPSTTLCVAVGIDNSLEGVTSIGTLSGGIWSWTTETLLITDASGSGQPRAISCSTATTCIVVGQDGNYQEITSVGTLSGGVWTWAPETVVTPDYTGSGELFGIGCIDSVNCLAVGLDNTGPSNPPHQGIVVIGALTSGPVPGGGLMLQPGSTQSFSVNPDPSNTITNVLIDGSSVGTPSYYTFSDVTSNHTIEADFAASSYNITASVSGSGSISPNGTTAVAYGADQLFSISPNAGYQISNVLVDGVSVGTPPSYTFTDVTAGHSIEADFSLLTHTLTASAGVGGSVSPSGAITVDDGSNQVINITPNTGYHISGYFSNGSYSCTPSGNNAVCTVSDIISNEYLTANFAINTNTITVSAQTGGSVSPKGAVVVNYGGSEIIDVTPSSGYHITGYSSDGNVSCTPSGADSTCTVSNITSDKYFTADFASTPITPTSTFTITASADGPGTITPSGDISVTDNGTQVFTIAANTGSNISKVLVDGEDQGPISSYSFTNVIAAHTIEVVFTTPVPVSTTTRSTHATPLVAAVPKPTANPITAITRFVSVQFNRVPTPIAIGFPWLLLILLLLMVLWASRLAYREARTVKARTELLHEEKRLSDTKNTFLQLATHYLSTPLAKLTSGLELLTTTNPDLTTLPKLQSQANDIHTAAGHILETVNSESAVQSGASTSVVSDKVISQAWRRLWIMVGVIGILGFLIDDLAHSAKQIRTSTVAEATHAAIYVLLCFILYGVLRYYRIQHQNHEATDGLISTQDNLSASRNRLIQTAYENLSVPVGSISLTAKELSSNTPAGRSILMAISDYRNILDKLKVVIELKNVPLDSTESIKLVDVLEPAVVSFTPAIEAKHLSVNYANDIAEQKVLADRNILNKIVIPILDNAIKFSSDRGIITIGYEITHNNLSLTITDNGQGINPDYMTRLFQPFSRAEADALTFNHEGIGLSLYTSKLLAESLHGDISLSSVVGKGTKVSIKLPKPTKAALARIARQRTTAQNVQPIKQQVVYG